VKHMGGSMPNMYAFLDKKKTKYQSPMTEVEGKIDNQPISVLVDSRDIHSYIKSNIVEIFHLQSKRPNESWLV
jgi:hypothetical protein